MKSTEEGCMDSGCLEPEKYVGCVHYAWNKLMHPPTTIEIEYFQCSFNVHWMTGYEFIFRYYFD